MYCIILLRGSQSMRLQGKVAIITGAAQGIGEAMARLFADHGATVVITGIQDHLGEAVADSIGPHRCNYIHCDVTDEDQVKLAVAQTLQQFNRIDILLCNAGIINNNQTITDPDLPAMDRLFAVNVRGAAVFIKHVGKAMIEGGIKGSIICNGSVSSCFGGFPGMVDYAMSKHALLGLARAACNDLGNHGIRVNCVSAYVVATPLTSGFTGMDSGHASAAYQSKMSLKGAPLTVEDVVNAILFLATDESSLISGHNLVVDGGFLVNRGCM